jgi:isopenicillin N synthase-like dioxygenase
MTIPVVDFNDNNTDLLIFKAACEFGFFILRNPPLDSELLDKAFDLAK